MDVIFWCARINQIISDSTLFYKVSEKEKQEKVLSTFSFTKDEMHAINHFASINGGIDKIQIFFRGQLLELIRWALLLCTDTPDKNLVFDSSKTILKFRQLLFMASDIWAKRVYPIAFSIKNSKDVDLLREEILSSERKSIESSTTALEPYRVIGRGRMLFEKYLPEYIDSFKDEFYKINRIQINDYFLCVCHTILEHTKPELKVHKIFSYETVGSSTNCSDLIQIYIRDNCQTIEELREKLWPTTCSNITSFDDAPRYDFLPLREKPFVSTENGMFILLDPNFLAEKASLSPLFLIKNKSNDQKYHQQLMGNFGKAFEDYTISILKRMYPNSQGLAKRLFTNIELTYGNNKRIEIDAYLNNVEEIIIFEIKASLLSEKFMLTNSSADYISDLKKKYIDKGIGQLSKIINVIFNNDKKKIELKFNTVKKVYPVLLTQDSLIDIPVHWKKLNDYFNEQLADSVRTITKPLTLMSVNTLEDLEYSINNFGLVDLLRDYTEADLGILTSLHNYIANSKYSQQMLHNNGLIDIFKQTVIEAKEKFYSNKISDNSIT